MALQTYKTRLLSVGDHIAVVGFDLRQSKIDGSPELRLLPRSVVKKPHYHPYIEEATLKLGALENLTFLVGDVDSRSRWTLVTLSPGIKVTVESESDLPLETGCVYQASDILVDVRRRREGGLALIAKPGITKLVKLDFSLSDARLYKAGLLSQRLRRRSTWDIFK